MKGWAVLPDGSRTNLIWISDWDFNWQGTYQLRSPRSACRPGRPVHLRVHVRQLRRQRAEPERAAPKRVHFGEQTTDEMAFLFLEVSPVKRSDWPALRRGNRRPLLDALRNLGGGPTTRP